MEKDINNLILKLQKYKEKAFKFLKQEVEYIINNNIRDIPTIEHTLDLFLNIYEENAYTTFYKLIDYYANIDKQSSIFYEQELEKIYKVKRKS